MATVFEIFMSAEMNRRISHDLPVGGNLTPNKFLKTSGIGLGIELVSSIYPEKTVTVGATNCDFTSIQDAIDFCTPADNDIWTVIIYSGTYAETLVLKPSIALQGIGRVVVETQDFAFTTVNASILKDNGSPLYNFVDNITFSYVGFVLDTLKFLELSNAGGDSHTLYFTNCEVSVLNFIGRAHFCTLAAGSWASRISFQGCGFGAISAHSANHAYFQCGRGLAGLNLFFNYCNFEVPWVTGLITALFNDDEQAVSNVGETIRLINSYLHCYNADGSGAVGTFYLFWKTTGTFCRHLLANNSINVDGNSNTPVGTFYLFVCTATSPLAEIQSANNVITKYNITNLKHSNNITVKLYSRNDAQPVEMALEGNGQKDIFPGVYGSLVCQGASSAQAISATPVLLTCFTANGGAYGVTPAHATDDLTVLGAGRYKISYTASFTGSDGELITFRIRKNGSTILTELGAQVLLGTSDTKGCSTAGIVTLAFNDKITVYVNSANPAKSVTIKDAQLCIERVS